MDRALMLMALGLDPRFMYTDHELHSAWRRRRTQVHPDADDDTMVDAAINTAYVTLIGQAPVPRPLEVRL